MIQKLLGGGITIRLKQMASGCRHWTGTLSVLLQDGTTKTSETELFVTSGKSQNYHIRQRIAKDVCMT